MTYTTMEDDDDKKSTTIDDDADFDYSATRTKRESVEAIEELLYVPFKLLDHGFVRIVDYMGSDSAVVRAARISYGKRKLKTPAEDRHLIRYLMRHGHTSPFEMCELKLHLRMPIFVARQWVRHRTASMNEFSGRYSVLPEECYVPDRLYPQSETDKQGRKSSSSPVGDGDDEKSFLDAMREDAKTCYRHYADMTTAGVAREQARVTLTLGFYTEFYWKIDLRNLLRFLALRTDPHAQYEIRVYAGQILDFVKLWVPVCYEAFVDYELEAYTLSRGGLEVVRTFLLKGGDETPATSRETQNKLSKREWNELMEKIF